MTIPYDFEKVEAKWRARWRAAGLYRFDVQTASRDEKFYNLVEFPYPSAEGLHVGHAYTYCGADTYGRYLRMRGRRVFQPIGFDSFGIHTENYALRVSESPVTLTARTIAHYREQLERLGGAWDWHREVVTSDPSYYRWTQWIFLQLHRAGLTVWKEAPVVWCPSCLTVLANEQLDGDRCERCGTVVGERVMRQWFLRITACADELLAGLDELDWPESAKARQREWIGRSEGVEVDFRVPATGGTLSTFTTRPDTLYGVTFLVVPPRRADLDGLRAIHPLTGREIPIRAADYVVESYGTGAVMGVPAHDRRDHEYALAEGLPIRPVILAEGAADGSAAVPLTGEGVLVDSGPFTGMSSRPAREAIADRLEEAGLGRRKVAYHLHDWLISRQRYWGPPIPIVHCPSCGEVGVPEDELPVRLPEVEDFRPTGTGRSPLASVDSFVVTSCPSCGGPGRRETDVSDTFFDSSWYFLRYPSTDVDDRPWDPERTGRVLPVDMYAGGPEHVVRHHLYARFVTRALHDLGLVSFAEPFPRIRLHGMLIKDGAKMSKSRGNVVDPDDYVRRVGADNLRMYLLFCGPWEKGGDFSDRGLGGIVRFANRAWRLLSEAHEPGPGGVDMRPLDEVVGEVGRDLERMSFNTAISRLMEVVSWARTERSRMSSDEWQSAARTITLLLAPFAPHMAEEIWERLGEPYSVHTRQWPVVSDEAPGVETVTLVVQVNGKMRARCELPAGASQEGAVAAALAAPNVRRHVGDRPVSRVVFVPDRLVNLVL